MGIYNKSVAKISIDEAYAFPINGFITIWWWRKGTLNQQYRSVRPIWEIFSAYETYLLCVTEENVEISEDLLFSHFERIG